MRRLVLNLIVAAVCILGGLLAVAGGSGGAPITVPPTVNATNWSSVSRAHTFHGQPQPTERDELRERIILCRRGPVRHQRWLAH